LTIKEAITVGLYHGATYTACATGKLSPLKEDLKISEAAKAK